MKKQGKTEPLDPAAVCKSPDLMAVTELLTKIGDKWSTFSILSLDLLGGRSRFSELERAIPGIPQRMLTGDKSPRHSSMSIAPQKSACSKGSSRVGILSFEREDPTCLVSTVENLALRLLRANLWQTEARDWR